MNTAGGAHDGLSSMALSIKASILFHRASHLTGQWTPSQSLLSLWRSYLTDVVDMQQRESQAFSAAFQSINRLIDTFRATLPPLTSLDPSHSSTRTTLMTHALTDAATMKLHGIFAYADQTSKQCCLAAAQNTVRFGGLNLQELGYMNPIMGVSIFHSTIEHRSYLFLDTVDDGMQCLH